MNTLSIALLHCAPKHKQHAHNLEMLLSLCEKAGKQGAQLVIAPEMCLSGYSFENREDICPFTDTIDGPTIRSLREIARQHDFYLCVGIAEREETTDLFYNTALTIDPQGEIVGRYRKINAEMRWACPGNPYEDNTFSTPWGRVGVLICSDSYHSLMPRITALRGADLLLIPANWPPMGLRPEEIWQVRARENGVHVAACNRTGQDLTMDCSQATSAVFQANGNSLFCSTSQDSEMFLIEIPLDTTNQLNSDLRQDMQQKRRKLKGAHDCCLNLSAIQDLTSFLQLPGPENLPITLHVPGNGNHPCHRLQQEGAEALQANGLHVLPCSSYCATDIEQLTQIALARQLHIVLKTTEPEDTFILIQPDRDAPITRFPADKNSHTLWFHDLKQARIAMADPAILEHPEPVLAAAKNGCDLIICPTTTISEEDMLFAGARTIEQTGIAVCGQNYGGIWMPPQGHARRQETRCLPDSSTAIVFDTRLTRSKRFQDRVDFPTLFKGILLL